MRRCGAKQALPPRLRLSQVYSATSIQHSNLFAACNARIHCWPCQSVRSSSTYVAVFRLFLCALARPTFSASAGSTKMRCSSQ